MRKRASRVMGVDSSTQSIAWAVYFNRSPEKFGESMLEGDFTARLGQIRTKFDRILREQKPDFVAIEKPVMINNKDVFGKLSKVVGVLQACCAAKGIACEEVTPKVWQYDIGNNSWTRAQKLAFKKQNPGKSTAWFNAEIRKRRKQYTIDYMRDNYGVNPRNDNQADAMGVARYAYYKMTKR